MSRRAAVTLARAECSRDDADSCRLAHRGRGYVRTCVHILKYVTQSHTLPRVITHNLIVLSFCYLHLFSFLSRSLALPALDAPPTSLSDGNSSASTLLASFPWMLYLSALGEVATSHPSRVILPHYQLASLDALAQLLLEDAVSNVKQTPGELRTVLQTSFNNSDAGSDLGVAQMITYLETEFSYIYKCFAFFFEVQAQQHLVLCESCEVLFVCMLSSLQVIEVVAQYTHGQAPSNVLTAGLFNALSQLLVQFTRLPVCASLDTRAVLLGHVREKIDAPRLQQEYPWTHKALPGLLVNLGASAEVEAPLVTAELHFFGGYDAELSGVVSREGGEEEWDVTECVECAVECHREDDVPDVSADLISIPPPTSTPTSITTTTAAEDDAQTDTDSFVKEIWMKDAYVSFGGWASMSGVATSSNIAGNGIDNDDRESQKVRGKKWTSASSSGICSKFNIDF
jgi:hypothetical protein